ncbi:MAG: hypothetical protein AMJ78_07990 [Omnitrophica WOR_2 bacterium SM23_29]|nr:MAG: hypothetical protein AMJ78_07990 [Omnitrophica WOR_2 bacterium SM23_29]
MRILLLTSHLNIGGIAVYTITLANSLCKRGHSVYVASSGGTLDRELVSDVGRIKVPLNTKSEVSIKVLLTVFRLRRFIRDENIEVIHAQTRVTQFAAHILSKLTGIPYVVTWHGFYRAHFFRKFFPCWGKRTIAISKTVSRHLIDVFRREEDKVRLIFNGIDTSKFVNDYSANEREDTKRRYGLKDGPIIGIISRLAPEKGHIYLIEAFKELLVEIPDAQLIIVGEGRSGSELKNKVRELGIESVVYFFGETLNTKEFLAIMDVFTRPSENEPFGLAIVEAMLMGVPVVATDAGGYKTILDEGRFGILVPPKDSVALKDALVRILTDSNLVKRLRETAREYAIQNFSADRMAEKVEVVYKEVI